MKVQKGRQMEALGGCCSWGHIHFMPLCWILKQVGLRSCPGRCATPFDRQPDRAEVAGNTYFLFPKHCVPDALAQAYQISPRQDGQFKEPGGTRGVIQDLAQRTTCSLIHEVIRRQRLVARGTEQSLGAGDGELRHLVLAGSS